MCTLSLKISKFYFVDLAASLLPYFSLLTPHRNIPITYLFCIYLHAARNQTKVCFSVVFLLSTINFQFQDFHPVENCAISFLYENQIFINMDFFNSIDKCISFYEIMLSRNVYFSRIVRFNSLVFF